MTQYLYFWRFYGLTKSTLAHQAYNLVEDNYIPRAFKDKAAGYGWVSSFVERHGDSLSWRQGSLTSLARVLGKF